MAAQVEAVGAGLEVRPHLASLAGVPVGDHGPRTGSGVSAPSGTTRGAAGLSHQARGGGFAVAEEAASLRATAIRVPFGSPALDADALGQTRGRSREIKTTAESELR